MFSISQLVETIKENIDPNTDFIHIINNYRHALNFNNDNYATCYIRPILITTKNHEEIDLTNIKFIKWTYNPHKIITYTNFSEEWFYLYISTQKKTYKGNSYYEHHESPIDPEDRAKTPKELEVIEKHKNDKPIKYQEIKNISKASARETYNADYNYY